MKEIERTILRKRLQQELEACKNSVERLEESSKPVAPDKALGRLTRMESLNDQGISSAALEQNRMKLHKLGEALDAIEQPGYGNCVVCKRPIPLERLMAIPESNRCVACAQKGAA